MELLQQFPSVLKICADGATSQQHRRLNCDKIRWVDIYFCIEIGNYFQKYSLVSSVRGEKITLSIINCIVTDIWSYSYHIPGIDDGVLLIILIMSPLLGVSPYVSTSDKSALLQEALHRTREKKRMLARRPGRRHEACPCLSPFLAERP